MNQISIEGFYPLLIIGAGALIRHLKKKAKEHKERAREEALPPLPPPIIIREVASPPQVTKPFIPPPFQKKIPLPLPMTKKKKPRIVKLISGLKHKQDLVLLSEILVNKHQVK